MLVEDVILVTITGRNDPPDIPENVTLELLPTGITVIVALKAGSVNAPIYIAADLILLAGIDVTASTLVAKSG